MTAGPVRPDPLPTASGLEADLALALELADAADQITTARFRAADLVVATKPDLTPVTEADRAVEERLRTLIGARRPGDALLGEEFGGELTDGRVWIIDPIDATKNYVRGVPVWATLIALADAGEVLLGVCSAPALGRRWWGAKGLGAFAAPLPGDGATPSRLAVSGVTRLADASLSISDPVGWPAGALAALTDRVWRSRAYGDFYSHVLVAEGAVDIAAEPELSVWDFAALIPIVEQAGGQIAGFDGQTGLAARSAITTNGLLAPQVVAALAAG